MVTFLKELFSWLIDSLLSFIIWAHLWHTQLTCHILNSPVTYPAYMSYTHDLHVTYSTHLWPTLLTCHILNSHTVTCSAHLSSFQILCCWFLYILVLIKYCKIIFSSTIVIARQKWQSTVSKPKYLTLNIDNLYSFSKNFID